MESYYKQYIVDEYNRGYADGKKNAQPPNANVVYNYHTHSGNSTSGGGCYAPIYHTHSGSCYKTVDCHWSGRDDNQGRYPQCPMCGSSVWADNVGRDNDGDGVSGNYFKFYCKGNNNGTSLVCSYHDGQFLGYALSCGKTTSTLESVVITYN